jgi:hypothetical protein
MVDPKGNQRRWKFGGNAEGAVIAIRAPDL